MTYRNCFASGCHGPTRHRVDGRLGWQLLGALPLFLCSMHVAGVDVSDAMEIRSGSMGLRGLGSKRTRSPAHALELEVAVDTVRARVAIDPACQVLDEENDYTSELPWRTPSPAASNAKLREGWKDWNSAESVPFLDFLDSNHDITDKKKRSDFVDKDNEASTVDQEPTGSQFVDIKDEESEEGFMFPGPADPSTEPDGWQKRDARTASDLQSADRVPVGVDRDSRDFVKLSVGRRERGGSERGGAGGRMGRSIKVRNLLAKAQRARATRLAQSLARPPDAPAPEEQSQDESETGRSANDETDSQVTEELSSLSKRGVIVRDLPQKARQEDVYAALSGYGELESVLMNQAGSFAHVLFTNEEACKAALLSKHVKVLDDDVELVRGPNCLGPVAKRGLHNPRRVAAISKPRSADAQEEDGFLGSRLVGKVNDYTFGTGLRRAQYWVQHDYVEGNVTEGWSKKLQIDEHCVAVYNLPPDANETGIRALFARCGAVKQVSINDIVAGESRYAVVEYTHKDAAEEAVAKIDGLSKAGHVLRVKLRGEAKDEYQRLVLDTSNLYAVFGASNSQPGHKSK